jgi:hypothetical protein
MTPEARYKSNYFDFPLGVRVANSLFSSYAKKKIDADYLLERAVQKTGLTDYGDEFFIEPLHHLVDDANAHTEFHALGAFLLKNKILINLVNRLWSQYWIKTEPEILKPLPPKVLITGLQRTGTTFLQRLLGNLPEFRGVISWEIVNPVPKSKKKNYYGMYEAKLAHIALNYINPEFKSIHSVNYDSLEEEVVMMDHAFVSTATQAALNVPNYSRWLEQQDQTKAYEDLKMWLQLLLWRLPADKFLLLKSPHHMEYLDAFFNVFPDTKIIQTHRTPVKTLASYCSMVHFGKKIFSPYSDPHKVGQYWLEKDKRLVQHCMDYRKTHDDRFLDIAYSSLVADPIAVAKEIYQHLGLTWTEKHTVSSEIFCANHKKNKFGKHSYALEDYGLNEAQVNNSFEEYLSTYSEYLK